MKTHLAHTTSHYTLCRFARWAVERMGHRVVSTTYYSLCPDRERSSMDTCRECRQTHNHKGVVVG